MVYGIILYYFLVLTGDGMNAYVAYKVTTQVSPSDPSDGYLNRFGCLYQESHHSGYFWVFV